MKKLQATLFSILLITLALTSCNIDGASGILREVASATTPLSIRYKQLLGYDTTYLYFRTQKGIERVTSAKANTSLVASTMNSPIQAAAYWDNTPPNKILYYTNNDAERAANQIRVIDTTNPSAAPGTIPVASSQTTNNLTQLSIKNLYQNSMILVKGMNGATKSFELLEYDGTNFTTQIAQFDMTSNDYDLDSVILQTGREKDSVDKDRSLVISFVDPNGSNPPVYEHHLVHLDSSNVIKKTSIGSNGMKIANFLYHDASAIYVLTTDGNLYYVTTPALTTTSVWTLMTSTTNTYSENAFAYAIDDEGGNYHLITKPTSALSDKFSLEVFTFVQGATVTSSTAKVDTGYAEHLSKFTVGSTLKKSATNLLVATDKNGIFEITITDATTGAGSSVGPEAYTF